MNTFSSSLPAAILAICGVLIVPVLALAQTTTTATNTPPTSSSTPPQAEPVPLPPPITDSRQAALQPIAQSRITNLAANVSNRLDASVRRLTNVSQRLDSRMNKLEAAGYTVTSARSAQRDALAQLQQAEASLRTIDVEVAAFVGSSDPLTAWVRLASIYGTIGEQVVTAHATLRECLQQLETASLTPVPPAEVATSTLPE